MSVSNSSPIGDAIRNFESARIVADEAWTATTASGGEPDLQVLQARAILLGVEATNLLLVRLLARTPTTPTSGQLPESSPGVQEQGEILTTSQAAREVGLSIATMRRHADNGNIPALRTPGGQRRFRRGDLHGIMKYEQPQPEKQN